MDKKKSNLDSVLEKLRNIGIKKISSTTHITEPNIEAILNKEFDKLDPTKAIGFTKILEREYSIDLSEWKKEFKEYREQIKKEEKEGIFIAAEEEAKEEEGSSKILFIVGIIALVIIAYGAYVFVSSTSKTTLNNGDVSKEKEIVKEIENKAKKKREENLPKEEISKSPLKAVETNKSEIFESNISAKIEKNESNESVAKEKKEELNVTKQEGNESNFLNSKAIHKNFIISPRARIWLGVIYLDDYSKKQFLTDKNISLDPSRDFLIVTGHGKFDIYIDNQKYHYDDPLKVRLLYKDQTLEKIDANIFKTINRGKPW